MPIAFNEAGTEFHLTNGTISYIVALLPDGSLGLAHFGPPLAEGPAYGRLIRFEGRAGNLSVAGQPGEFCLDFAPREYPTPFRGDFRVSALEAQDADGAPLAIDLAYSGYLIRPGKPSIPGLPSTYVDEPAEAETLSVYLRDPAAGVEVELHYSLFRDFPAIARRAAIRNIGGRTVRLTRALSAAIDFPDADWDFVTFPGAWARERRMTKRRLAPGSQSVGSLRGQSSHQHNPAVMLARPDTTETAGEAYGFALVYSGNFLAQVDVGSHGDSRLALGINPAHFTWDLAPGAVFDTPEVVAAYAPDGLGALSDCFHRLFARNLARGPWRDAARPILVNNWEGTYFNFNEAKLLDIARASKDLGAELFVLDDGWFGKRDDDTSSLGDWEADPAKLPDGIGALARRINELGLRFGLWIEPEMVNPRSRLFEAHPDWAVGPMGGQRTLGRNQYVLDLSRPEVVDHLAAVLTALLRSGPIDYVKWDMNRNLSDPVSAALPPDRQKEFFHRYQLGVYELYRRLTAEFPNILFESCSGGGGRFDPGLLAYAPQAWASDDSDAVERLAIQWGTSFFYPASSIGAHVSAVPNHQVGRVTPLGTRAAVAYFGAFGYELDPCALTDAERDEIRAQIAFYKDWRKVCQFGTFHRLRGYTGTTADGEAGAPGNEVAWMSVAADRRRAIVLRVQILARPNQALGRLRLRGLDPDLSYTVRAHPSVPVAGEASVRYNDGYRGGDELMGVGLLLGGDGWNACRRGDFACWLFSLEAANR